MKRTEVIAARVLHGESDDNARELAIARLTSEAHAVGYRLTSEPHLLSHCEEGSTYAAIARRTIRHWMPKALGGTR